jgi:hypothetical protein
VLESGVHLKPKELASDTNIMEATSAGQVGSFLVQSEPALPVVQGPSHCSSAQSGRRVQYTVLQVSTQQQGQEWNNNGTERERERDNRKAERNKKN